MGEFVPSIPIPIQIRKVIFEKFNDTEVKFTNDEIFKNLQEYGVVEKSWIIDNMEEHFKEICDSGLVRCIAQDLTTQWYKLFDVVEKFHCNSCKIQVYIGKSEKRECTNPECKASI